MPLPVSPTILLAAACIALVIGPHVRFRAHWVWSLFFLTAMVLAAYALITDPVPTAEPAIGIQKESAWVHDSLAQAEQWIVLAFGVLTGIAVFESPWSERDTPAGYGFLLFLVAGLMLVARSNDFLQLALSLETVSLAMIAITRCGAWKWDSKSTDGSVPIDSQSQRTKQFWFAALASGGLWLGIAILANALATTHFTPLCLTLTGIVDRGNQQDAIGVSSKVVLLAVGLTTMSLFSRIGVVPFQLSVAANRGLNSTWLTGCLTQAGQLAGSIALCRLFGRVLVGVSQPLTTLTMTVCLATFVYSAVIAMRALAPGSRSISRMVTSLMTLQSGWIGVGLMTIAAELDHSGTRWGAFADQAETVAQFVFLQLTGLLASFGVCCSISYLSRNNRGVEFLEELKGLGQFSPASSTVLVICLASALGCPLTAGFWARWMTLLAGGNLHSRLDSSIFTPHAGLRFVMLAGTVSTLFFALVVVRLAREMFLEQPLARPAGSGRVSFLTAGTISAMTTLVLGFAPQMILTPLRSIGSPRSIAPTKLQEGSGKNSIGMLDGSESGLETV